MHVHWGTEIKIEDSLFLSAALYWLSERTRSLVRSLWHITLRVICSVHCIFFLLHCSNTVAVAFFSISDSYSVDFIQMLVLCVRCACVCTSEPPYIYMAMCVLLLSSYMRIYVWYCVSFLISHSIVSVQILSFPLSYNRLFFFCK